MKSLIVLTIFSAVVSFAVADGGRASPDDFQSRCIAKDGVFLPIPGNCNQYIICVKGTAVLSTCGAFHFDARRSVCDVPGKAGCISFGPQPFFPTDGVCSGHTDGSTLPVPGNRSRYYFCMREKAFLKDCGSLQFDEKLMTCVAVNEKPAPQLSVSPCFGLANGAKVPVAGNPKQYYFCMNNKDFLKDCGNMYFIPKYSSCELLPERELSLEREHLPEREPAPQPSVSPCFGLANGAKVPVAGNPKQYYFCVNNKYFLKDCGNMYFIPKYSSCELSPELELSPERKPDTVELPKVILPSAQTESVGEYEQLAMKMCQNKRLGSFTAAPGSCSEYYVCMGSSNILKSCGSMQFNPITSSCDMPSNVRCSIQKSEAVYGTQEFLAASTSDNSTQAAQVCNGLRSGIFVAAPGKCTEFYFCFRNQGYLKTCGKRHFNPITLSCVDVEMSNCVEPIPLVTDTIPIVADTLATSCLNRNNGVLLRHPTECGKFLICDNSVSVEMVCPAGLHFNSQSNYCDWPEIAKCVSSSS